VFGLMWVRVGAPDHTSMNNAVTSVPFVIWATRWAWDRGRVAGVALSALALAFQVSPVTSRDTLLTPALSPVRHLSRGHRAGPMARLQALGVASVCGSGVAIAPSSGFPRRNSSTARRVREADLGQAAYGSWHPELLRLWSSAKPTAPAPATLTDGRLLSLPRNDAYVSPHRPGTSPSSEARPLAIVGLRSGSSCGRRGVLISAGSRSSSNLANRIPVVGSSRNTRPVPSLGHARGVSALAAVGVDRIERPFASGSARLRSSRGAGPRVDPILLYVYAPVWTIPALDPAVPHRPLRWLGGADHRRHPHGSRKGRRPALTIGDGDAGPLAPARSDVLAPPAPRPGDLLGSALVRRGNVSPSYWTNPPLSARKLKADPTVIRVFGSPIDTAASRAMRPAGRFPCRSATPSPGAFPPCGAWRRRAERRRSSEADA